ncbi:copper chaperone PCu(A)C (plasmid) [Pseudorhodobacter turbinis]|uniref:Copper chaperone PCu(A)C n=1 Tax=Pseudorhodobacter turbinis TaxID=2500533 RepID=A0A4P8EL18_9RHOB|nr:copper chaperone PCu(A)C [Pseudorhodobacter turbinis]QCO57960.1 copper chaperone PCu(A)C [Pseudorhodobacter turbinis]
MTYKFVSAATCAAFLALASAPMALANDITVTDAYARVSGPTAKSAAAFMVIDNTGEEDRLIDVKSDVAMKTELHTHLHGEGGVMKMVHVEEGFAIPADGHHALARGSDHVMFMGLKDVPAEGETFTLTLTFEKAGDVVVEVPVNNERTDGGMGAGKMDHGKMDHGAMKKGDGN